jgi:hypothetical protein
MKKSTTLLLIVFLSTIQLFSQNKNTFSSEIAPAFTGTGDALGISFSNELSRTLINNLSLGLTFELQDFSNSNYNDALDYKNFGLNLHYQFNITSNIKFMISAGGFYRMTNHISFYNTRNITDSHGDIYQIFSTTSDKYDGFGYAASLGFIFPINEKISFSTKASLQNDTNGDITWTLRPGINFHF